MCPQVLPDCIIDGVHQCVGCIKALPEEFTVDEEGVVQLCEQDVSLLREMQTHIGGFAVLVLASMQGDPNRADTKGFSIDKESGGIIEVMVHSIGRRSQQEINTDFKVVEESRAARNSSCNATIICAQGG